MSTMIIDALNVITGSKVFLDLKQNLDNGLIEKEEYIAVLTALNTDAIKMAPEFAKATLDLNIAAEQRIYQMQLLTKDILYKQAQIESEQARKLLLNEQRKGFDDNVVIKNASITNETIGMIQSGGNEAPATLWTQQATAMARLETVAGKHEEL